MEKLNIMEKFIMENQCHGKMNIMEKFVKIKSKPLNPFPKQQCVTPNKVGLRGDDSLNQETQVLSTTCVTGHFCELKLAELLSFSPNSKKLL